MALRGFTLLGLALCASLASPARAEEPSADQIAAGRKFAKLVCGACYVVTTRRDERPVLNPRHRASL